MKKAVLALADLAVPVEETPYTVRLAEGDAQMAVLDRATPWTQPIAEEDHGLAVEFSLWHNRHEPWAAQRWGGAVLSRITDMRDIIPQDEFAIAHFTFRTEVPGDPDFKFEFTPEGATDSGRPGSLSWHETHTQLQTMAVNLG
jgi:hypothetical protein